MWEGARSPKCVQVFGTVEAKSEKVKSTVTLCVILEMMRNKEQLDIGNAPLHLKPHSKSVTTTRNDLIQIQYMECSPLNKIIEIPAYVHVRWGANHA